MADEVTINDGATMRPGTGSGLGRIDQYELLRELGGGGFGCVFLARDTVSGIDVAVKGLPPEVKHDREELENIRENFALVSRLHHPNIAAALVLHPAKAVAYATRDAMEKLRVFEGDALMVMEYAPGTTLSSWRKQFPGRCVPVAQALEIVRQIAEALDYAHARKIVHRDIKPANVMVDPQADGGVSVKVLDFGLAAEIRSSLGRVSREIRETSGTRPYMAPEQWSGDKQGPATDQYALAVLFHELVSGAVPYQSAFDSGDPVVMMANVVHQPVKVSGEIPTMSRKALLRALAKDPSRRFATCTDFVAGLKGSRLASFGLGRARWLRIGLILCAFAALAALGCFVMIRQREAESVRRADFIRQAELARQSEFARQEKREAEKRARLAQEKRESEAKAKVEEEQRRADEAKQRREAETIAEEKRRREKTEKLLEQTKAKQEAEERERLAKAKQEAEAAMERERQAKAKQEAEERERLAKAKQEAEAAMERERQAKAKQEAERKAQRFALIQRLSNGSEFVPSPPVRAAGTVKRVSLPNGGEMEFVWCPPGRFLMGSPETEPERNPDETQHLVTLTKGFWIGRTEVTREQWKCVMGRASFAWTSLVGADGAFPVDKVSFDQCRDFCRKLGFRLPTEAEWEYACRAGTATPFSFGSALNGDRANCSGGADPYGTTVSGPNSFGSKRVGSYAPNPWGILDMHGNLYEWCADVYSPYPEGDAVDPAGAASGMVRVVRGGCWNFAPKMCRSAFRNRHVQTAADTHTGFRVCCDRLPD